MEPNLALPTGSTGGFRLRPHLALSPLPPLPKPPSVPFIVFKALLISAVVVEGVLLLVRAGFATGGAG